MDRREFLVATGGGIATLAGCLRPPTSAPPGRIELLGHDTGEDVQFHRFGHVKLDGTAFYTFGHVSDDGEWGVVGSFPERDTLVASTLVDLTAVEEPSAVHQLDSAGASTRTNDVKFDAHRDGLYYRSQEPQSRDHGERGIEVVDFGYREGTPEQPVVLAQLEVSEVGIHKLTTHPEEELLYLVNMNLQSETGVFVVDVSSPAAPEVIDRVGPAGGCHDVEYDPVREVLHGAYIAGGSEGYLIYDASNPYNLEILGHFRYDDHPGYTEVGEPGFEGCHQAHWDPERDLAIIGDEVSQGVPGGKHIFDIGWDEGSLEDPQPVGFTHSPDARTMDGADEMFWWTTHFHDVVYDGGVPLLVDGGYRQGAWVCNIEDPRNPVPTERFATTNRSVENPEPELFAWGAVYNAKREFVFVTDSYNGAFTFDVTAKPARGIDHRGPAGHYSEDVLRPGSEG